MPEIVRSSILKAYTMATEVKKLDLPVNPLSHLCITISGFNVTDEATLAEILSFLNKITITHRGKTIIGLESEDLAALMMYLFWRSPMLTQNVSTDNATRQLTLIVPFGRTLYNPQECFPATKKGELTLTLDTTVPSASLDNAVIDIETIELPDANPTQHLKCELYNVAAPSGTGDNDVALPIGNLIDGIIFYSTTFPGTSSHAYGINEVTLRVNNKEHTLGQCKTASLIGEMATQLVTNPRDIAAFGQVFPKNYFWMRYNADYMDTFLFNSEGLSSYVARLNMQVAEVAKVIPVQLEKVA